MIEIPVAIYGCGDFFFVHTAKSDQVNNANKSYFTQKNIFRQTNVRSNKLLHLHRF